MAALGIIMQHSLPHDRATPGWRGRAVDAVSVRRDRRRRDPVYMYGVGVLWQYFSTCLAVRAGDGRPWTGM